MCMCPHSTPAALSDVGPCAGAVEAHLQLIAAACCPGLTQGMQQHRPPHADDGSRSQVPQVLALFQMNLQPPPPLHCNCNGTKGRQHTRSSGSSCLWGRDRRQQGEFLHPVCLLSCRCDLLAGGLHCCCAKLQGRCRQSSVVLHLEACLALRADGTLQAAALKLPNLQASMQQMAAVSSSSPIDISLLLPFL